MADRPASPTDYAAACASTITLPGNIPDPQFANTPIPLAPQTLYKNRGAYLGALIYWISVGSPSAVPPAGLAITDYCFEIMV